MNILACESGKEIRRIRQELQAVENVLLETCEAGPPPIQPPPPVEPPTTDPVVLSEVIVRPPGTATVFARPVVVDLPITARLQGNIIHIEWPALMLDRRIWSTQTRNLGQGRQPYFGNSGLIYRNMGGDWVADATEWMRPGREDEGTSYPYNEKWRHGEPDFRYPIGLFVAGPWRYNADRPEWYHRTNITWLTWPELKPWTP